MHNSRNSLDWTVRKSTVPCNFAKITFQAYFLFIIVCMMLGVQTKYSLQSTSQQTEESYLQSIPLSLNTNRNHPTSTQIGRILENTDRQSRRFHGHSGA